jgi:hypothetical protein
MLAVDNAALSASSAASSIISSQGASVPDTLYMGVLRLRPCQIVMPVVTNPWETWLMLISAEDAAAFFVVSCALRTAERNPF